VLETSLIIVYLSKVNKGLVTHSYNNNKDNILIYIYLYKFSFSLANIYLGHSLETMPVNCSQVPAQDRDDLGKAQPLFLFLSASRVLYTSSMVF
jgi:hypothetical protein